MENFNDEFIIPDYSQNKKRKRYIFILIFFVLAFISGMIIDSFAGPIVKINVLTKIETMEKEMGTKEDKEKISNEIISITDECYVVAPEYEIIAGGLYNQIIQAEEKYMEEKKTTNINYEKIAEYAETETCKAFFKDLEKNRLRLSYDIFTGYTVTPDMKYFLDKYGEAMDEDTKDYLSFRNLEVEKHLFNEEVDCIDIDEVVKRLDYISRELKKDTRYADTYQILRSYYLDVLKGETHDFFNKVDNPEELNEYALKKFKELSSREDYIGEIAKSMVKGEI